MRKVSNQPGRLLLIVTLAALLVSAGAALYGSASAPASTKPITLVSSPASGGELDVPSLGGAGKEGESGDIKSAAFSEDMGNLYPIDAVPPVAKQRALDYSRQHVADGLPAGLSWPQGGKLSPQSPLTLTPGQWTSLGPQPILSTGAQQGYTYGNVSGRQTAIAVDPTMTSTVYVGLANGGVWKSTNCCSSATVFTPTMDGSDIASLSIGALELDPANPQIIYAGTGEQNFSSDSLSGEGLLKSTDGGASWTVYGQSTFGYGGGNPPYGGVNQRIAALAIDPHHSSTIVAGTNARRYGDTEGLYISNDGGVNWSNECQIVNYAGQRHAVTDIALDGDTNPTTIYAAIGVPFDTNAGGNDHGWNGIFKSTLPANGCPTSWTLVSTGAPWPAGTGTGTDTTVGRIQLAMYPANHQIIYAMVENANTTFAFGLFKTTDGGATWSQQSGSSAYLDCLSSNSDRAQDWYNIYVRVDPADSTIVYVGLVDIYRSTDSGASFTNITDVYSPTCPQFGTVHPDQHAFAFLGNGSNFIVGGDGGSWFSSDSGSTWTDLNSASTFSTAQFYDGDISPNFLTDPNPQALGGLQDNGTINYLGGSPSPLTWPERYGGDGFFAELDPHTPYRAYEELPSGSINCASSPQGPYASCAPSYSGDRLGFSTPFVLDHYNSCTPTCTHIILGSNRVWESITGGLASNQWHVISGDLTKNLTQPTSAFSVIKALAFAPGDTATIFVGSGDGNVQYTNNANTGNMATWVNLTDNNTTLPNRSVSSIAVDRNSALTAYVGLLGFDEGTPSTPGHVYQVTCAAACASFTWANKSGNLPNIPVQSIATNPLDPSQVFIGTDIGFYYTNNIGQANPVWNRFSNGMPNVSIWSLNIDNGNTTLAAFTHGRGLYAIPLPGGPITLTPTPALTPQPTTTPASTPTDCPNPFVDITGNVFYTAIHTLNCRGVVNGVDVAHYGPAGTSTRGQFAKVVVLGFGTPFYTPTSPDFSDVPASYFAYLYIESGFHAGILSGFDQSGCSSHGAVFPCYLPNLAITRGQLTKLVVSAGHYPLYTPTTPDFSDVPPSNVFYASIETAYHNSVVGGYPDHTFRPNNNIRRDEMAQIVFAGIIHMP